MRAYRCRASAPATRRAPSASDRGDGGHGRMRPSRTLDSPPSRPVRARARRARGSPRWRGSWRRKNATAARDERARQAPRRRIQAPSARSPAPPTAGLSWRRARQPDLAARAPAHPAAEDAAEDQHV
jgi:hypothetical protein